MKLEEKTLSSKRLFKNFFMELCEDEVLLPNNKKSGRVYVKHEGAAAVLPITKEGTVILIKQFRYPIRQVVIEIPAGKKDQPDESGLICATRELEEETGYVSSRIEHVQNIHNCLGYSDEMIELFIAYDCVLKDNPMSGDDDEFIQVLEYSKEEVKDLLKKKEITDAKTIIMLQHFIYGLDNV